MFTPKAFKYVRDTYNNKAVLHNINYYFTSSNVTHTHTQTHACIKQTRNKEELHKIIIQK